MQASLLLVFCVISVLLFALIGRLVYIMQTDGERYAKAVLSRQSYVSSVLPYKRGNILDSKGTVLARSELEFKLILDPKRLLVKEKKIASTKQALKKYFEIPEETIDQILKDKPSSRYVIVKKNIAFDAMQKFEKADLEASVEGVWFEEEYIRKYPYDTLASDVLGFTSGDDIGLWGLEKYYNSELSGTNGREYGYYSSDLNVKHIVNPPKNGNTLVTTIDADIQRIVQEKIKEFNAEIGSKSIGVLVMNPNNGAVIAMASNQEYNLNSPRNLEGIYGAQDIDAMSEQQKIDALNALWKNDVISSGFEPGSTWKPMTISAALEENLISPDSTYHCDGGQTINGVHIKCSNRTGHGDISLTQALMFSCNDALMQIVSQEGKDLFYQYQKNFGMGQKSGIDLPGEELGLLIEKNKLGNIELATSSFGQSFNTTMIQLASAFSSVVNGGNYYVPHVMKKLVNDKGATMKEYDKVLSRKTVSESTSRFIKEALYQTVEAGTAKGAQVEGYAIGGKTGTAQKLPRDAKTYVVSFIGCVPASNPELVIYVTIDEPQNVVKQADSSIATKFAAKILKEILPVAGLYPEGEIDYLLPSKAPTPTPPPIGTIIDEGNLLGDEDTQNGEEGTQNGEEGTINGEEGPGGETPQTPN